MSRNLERLTIIVSCLIGNVLEWFDFAVYGYLAPILAGQFFPSGDRLVSILLTYGVFAIGFVARPFGAIIFGYIGDTYGRKTALIASSVTMAVPTILIGLLPVYSQVGILAPLLLVGCRIFQGLSVGGEFTSSFVYLVEKAPEGKKGFYSCWADFGCNLGMILGCFCLIMLNIFLTPEQLASYGWRLPFLSGVLMAGVATFMRSKLFESYEFVQSKKTAAAPLKTAFLNHPSTLISSGLLVAVNSLGFYVLVVFIPNQAVLLGKFLPQQIYFINIFIIMTVMIASYIAASLCDYFDKTKIYLIGVVSFLIFSYPVFYALAYSGSSVQITMMSLLALSVGFCFGPRPLFLVATFPVYLRLSAISFSFNVANAVFGGGSPLLGTYLVAKTGSIQSPAILMILAGFITLFSIFKLKNRVKI